jgi:uncharacterized protein YndB with AHSA1/START domain
VAKRNRSNEIKITRIYDAPVAAVWDGWTDPDKVARWWGPRGFTLTTHSKDLRPGGTWVYTMHGPDGTDYPYKTVYHEVERHTRLVYDHGGSDDRAPLFRVSVQFAALAGGRTKMEMRSTLATPEAADEMRVFIKNAGGDATWDRLAEHLDQATSGKERFVINRSFDAPIARMYEMWTDPEHFLRWIPPVGFTMTFLDGKIAVGSTTRWVMSNDAGMKMYGRAQYRELSPPHRIVYTQQFCDAEGQVARHPAAPTWPETMLTTVTLTEEEPERTRVTVTFDVEGNATAEEWATFIQARGGMTLGWGGSFDKLEALLG